MCRTEVDNPLWIAIKILVKSQQNPSKNVKLYVTNTVLISRQRANTESTAELDKSL